MAGNVAGTFISTLRGQLATRIQADADFSDVNVWIVGEATAGLEESVVLIRPDAPVPFTQEHAAFGSGRRNEGFTVPGVLYVTKAGKASDASATFEAAMNRAQDLLDHIVEEIRDNPPAVGSFTARSIVASGSHTPYHIEQGWAVATEFDIDVTARVQ